MNSHALGYAFGGEFNLRGAQLDNGSGFALRVEGTEIASAALWNGLRAKGNISAISATLGGQLSITDASFVNPGKDALILDRANIKGLAQVEHTTVIGQTSFSGATIAGQLLLSRSCLHNPGDVALVLETARIAGGAQLDDMKVHGGITASGAVIQNQLAMDGSSLNNSAGDALIAEWMEVAGDLRLVGTTVCGTIRLVNGSVQGRVDLTDADIRSKSLGTALSLEQSTIRELCLGSSVINGVLDLSNSSIGNLDTAEKFSTSTGSLKLSGWQVRDISGAFRSDFRLAADWLKSAEVGRTFIIQPWHEIARVYDRNGQSDAALQIRHKAAWRAAVTSRGWSRVKRIAYGVFTGHGYYPFLASLWLTFAIFSIFAIASSNANAFTPAPANRIAYANPVIAHSDGPVTGATSCGKLTPRTGCFQPEWYARRCASGHHQYRAKR